MSFTFEQDVVNFASLLFNLIDNGFRLSRWDHEVCGTLRL